MATNTLGWADIVVIIVYFAFVLAVGLYSARKSKGDSVSGYFLASRNMHWIPVGASLFASNVGSGHFIGLASSGASSGIGVAAFEINAIFILMMLGWLFVPVYMSSGVYTMPEYLRERFGGQRIRIYLSTLALILYVFTKISADLFAGALFIQEAIGKTSQEWMYISVLILLGIAALFTITGGLTAVIWTDFVQTILMIVGAVVLMAISINEVGGYEQMIEKYPYAIASGVPENLSSCAIPPDYSFSFFRPAGPGESDMPWPGMIFGIAISSIWYWCADQVIVQRTLASKTILHAKAGCCLAAILKFLPLFLLVFPGICARIIYPDEVACVDPEKCKAICGSEVGCTNIAYVKLVLGLLPSGVRGMMLAVMMAALMSSLTSIFNSSSTIFTIDIWERVRKVSWKEKDSRSIELEKLIVGRAFVVVLVIISVIWIPVIQNSSSSQLFVYIQSISSFLSPPICAVYILAVFWKRTNEPGAFWGLMLGLVIGLIRFILEFGFPGPAPCSGVEDTRPEFIRVAVGNFHFLYFGMLLFCISSIVTVVISLITEPIPNKCLHRLTYQSRFSEIPRISVREWKNEKDDKLPPSHNTKNGLHSTAPTQSTSTLSFLYKICGFKDEETGTHQVVEELSPEDKAKQAAEFLHEDPFHKKLIDGTAITIMVGATFFWGFYA